LRQIGKEVLVVRMQSMLSQIRGLGVVQNIVEGRDYWTGPDMSKERGV
jgi:hypothetical protein